MKKLLALILIPLAFHVCAQSNNRHPYRPIKTIITDLNNDSKPDTIVLISSLEGRNSFNKISISLAGSTKKTFKARDYWTVVDSEFLIKNKNDFSTKLLFLKKTNKHAVILLFGEIDGAGYRGEFSIINIENNHIHMPFDALNDNKGGLDIEVPVELTALENNERLCFVYTGLHEYDGFSTKSMKDKGISDIGTYVPYLAYPVDDSCKLNKVLSKKYMEEHYVFAGFEYSEKINILYPRDGGKPRIWKKLYYH
jgi:hypothetical protein